MALRDDNPTDLAALRARLRAERGPSIAKAKAYLKESSKLRAAAALAHALSALRWSRRQLAEYVGTNEKTIRLWLEASQQPAWIPLALPRDGYVAYLSALADAPPPSRTGTDDY